MILTLLRNGQKFLDFPEGMEVAPTRAINPRKISFDDLDLEEDGKEGL